MTTAKNRPVVRGISSSVSWVRWSPRIGSIEDLGRRKTIAYVGFFDLETAERFYNHVLTKRPDWRWRPLPQKNGDKFHDGRGLCRPRPAERLSDCAFEVKWHYPDPQFIRGLILMDNGDDIGGHQAIEAAYRSVKETVYNPTPVSPAPKKRRKPQEFGYKEYPQDHGYYA